MIDCTPPVTNAAEITSRRPRAAAAPHRYGTSAPMGVAEIVTVCMGDLIHELREFLPSARVAFPGVPIYVYTDRAVDALAIGATVNVGNVTVSPTEDVAEIVSLDRVARHSDYWQPWPIYWKIRAVQDRLSARAPDSRDGVMLADCDITFRMGFERPFYADVALSPFYWGRRDIAVPGGGLLQHRDGEFNAGLLVTRSRAFADWWMQAYLSGEGGFYEQGCLDLVPGRFLSDYISPLHNYGKWRFAAPGSQVRSYHQHVLERCNRMDVGSLKMAAQRAAAEARETLAHNPALRQ
jgi:hypothetical protein